MIKMNNTTRKEKKTIIVTIENKLKNIKLG